jgi:4-carboxymuconolactone decarboxylase
MTQQPALNDRYERGLKLLAQVAGVDRPPVLDALADIAPDLGRYTVEFAYGDVYAREGLTLRERQLVTVAALTAMGNAAPQLTFHVNGALHAGCTPREIVETMIHTSVYAGFPAALNGVTVAKQVFASRDEPVRVEPDTDTPSSQDRYQRGLAALESIDGEAGAAVIASLADIAPDLARYIIEYAFGDIYLRGGLDLRTREIVTIAMCAALGTARPQLKVHVHGLLNVGGTRQEAVEVAVQMAVYAGFPASLNAITAIEEVLAERAA